MALFTFIFRQQAHNFVTQVEANGMFPEALILWLTELRNNSTIKVPEYDEIIENLDTLELNEVGKNVWNFSITINSLPGSVYGIKTSEEVVPDPVYNIDDAVETVKLNLPEEYKKSLNDDDVYKILETGFEYQQQIGLINDGQGEFMEYDEDEAAQFIQVHLSGEGKSYDLETIKIVLRCEEIYMKQVGIIQEDDLFRLYPRSMN